MPTGGPILETTREIDPLPREPKQRIVGPGTLLAAIALLILLGLGYCATRMVPGALLGRNTTNITNDVVISQIRAVAKLVSSEATVRDVIVYENTWYGSTKRSLVVVTGRLFAGIDFRDNPDVSIDHAKRVIKIRNMETYDEHGGLWNPFTPEDRNLIQRQARAQLTAAGGQLELIRHANESAIELLQLLLAKDGYTVDVALR
jgi:hypothetical protein